MTVVCDCAGTEVSTQFVISCQDWTSTDSSVLQYTFYYMVDGGKQLIRETSGQDVSTSPLKLPAGAVEDSYDLTVMAVISSASGSSVNYTFMVNVSNVLL